jgi:hypothetical protein
VGISTVIGIVSSTEIAVSIATAAVVESFSPGTGNVAICENPARAINASSADFKEADLEDSIVDSPFRWASCTARMRFFSGNEEAGRGMFMRLQSSGCGAQVSTVRPLLPVVVAVAEEDGTGGAATIGSSEGSVRPGWSCWQSICADDAGANRFLNAEERPEKVDFRSASDVSIGLSDGLTDPTTSSLLAIRARRSLARAIAVATAEATVAGSCSSRSALLLSTDAIFFPVVSTSELVTDSNK